MRSFSENLTKIVGQKVEVAGWVNARRDHGGLIFIDLRDHTGIIQLVITPETKEAFQLAEGLRSEFVVRAEGEVKKRRPELVNPNIKTGEIELAVTKLEILNRAETPPFGVDSEGGEISEELRLKYRYLDLRRPRMQKILRRRAEYYRVLRDYMNARDFIEVTTPILANSSPEGARDFLVPSRVHPGKFYALPQAPQQFKQLLMVGGVPRYYQIAACFRDEDPRADRLYGDFYQLDLEMAFATEGETVREMMEPLVKQLVKEFAGKKLLSEEIPRIPYRVAMEEYGVDKPDLRYEMKLVELTEAVAGTEFKVFQAPCVKGICVKGGADLTRSQIDSLTAKARSLGAGGLAYLTVEEGKAKGPIAKFLSEDEISRILGLTKAENRDIIFFGADERTKVNKVLGQLRIALADQFGLKDENTVALCWIVDFPFYEWNETEKKLDFGHNPFSMPKGGMQALNSAETDAEKLELLADQYDMVMNGYEICSGAVRNHSPEIMYKVFEILGFDQKYVEERFGGMISAFKFGAPPHAGCAFGIDRIFMVLMGIENIRDVVAFPKNGSGVDLMMNSPAAVDEIQLREANIKILQ